MLSSPSASSSPKGLEVYNFNSLLESSTLSPRGSCVSSDAEFVHHLIQQHLDISSPSTPSSHHQQQATTRQRASSLQPLPQKPSYIPLSPSHQHFHLLMSGRQQQPNTLPPIEVNSPTSKQSSCFDNGGLFQKKPLQMHSANPQTMIKEKLKFQLLDVQKANCNTTTMRQSLSAENFNAKHTMPLTARNKKADKEWDNQKLVCSPPTVTSSWVAPLKDKHSPDGSPTTNQTNTFHRWNQRMDKKLRDLEFHYSGGPTRVCHMKYLNDPNTEVRLPFKIDTEMPSEIVAEVKQPQKKKKKDKARLIEK